MEISVKWSPFKHAVKDGKLYLKRTLFNKERHPIYLYEVDDIEVHQGSRNYGHVVITTREPKKRKYVLRNVINPWEVANRLNEISIEERSKEIRWAMNLIFGGEFDW